MVTLKQTKRFHDRKKHIGPTILKQMDDREVIYGNRAINKRLPKKYRKPTTDYDIFTPKPKIDARQTERALDKKMGFNAFEVVKAQHPGTRRVRSRVDGEVYADYTKPEKKVPSTKIRGKRYATTKWLKKQKKETLKNPEAKFRHAKDKDTLNRLLLAELLAKKRAEAQKRRRKAKKKCCGILKLQNVPDYARGTRKRTNKTVRNIIRAY